MENRYVYKVEDVVGDLNSHPIPTILSRTYIEQKEIRDLMMNFPLDLDVSCDFGAGFGRLTPVLKEFSPRVFAFEREQEFTKIIEQLNPDVEVRSLQWLYDTKSYTDLFNAILCWTVIQHMHEDEAIKALSEIKRIMKPGGHLILCEETKDTGYQMPSKEHHICSGRSVSFYETQLYPEFSLLFTKKRPKEATNYRDVGTIMVFRKNVK